MPNPRKPSKLKLLQGTFRKDRSPKNEPKPQPIRSLRPPGGLSAAGRKVWKEIAPELARIGVLANVDREMFAVWCEARADWLWAQDTLKKQGKVIKTPNGHLQAHPALTIKRQSADLMRKLGAEFGLTPSARTKIEVALTKPLTDEEEGVAQEILD